MRPNPLVLILAIPLMFLIGVACQLATAGNTTQAPATQEPAVEEPRAVIESTSTPQPVPTSTRVVPTATPTPLPDRSDCAEIFGTDYHSPQEREWYLANCLPTPTPVPDVPDVPLVPAPAPPAIPGPELEGERWILVDIPTQTTSAMIGDQVLYTALATTGKDDWETPVGTFYIGYRVENETMTGESIGAEENYVLEDVLYTQYFTNEGHALHLNYWRSDDYFGNIRSSHGCIGLRLADAEFFWNFADYGTRVTIQ